MGNPAPLAKHVTGGQQAQLYFENGETPAFCVVPACRWGNYEQLRGGIKTLLKITRGLKDRIEKLWAGNSVYDIWGGGCSCAGGTNMGKHGPLAIHVTGGQQVQLYFECSENLEIPAFYVLFPPRWWGIYMQLQGGILT